MKKNSRNFFNYFLFIYFCVFLLSLCTLTFSKYTGVVRKQGYVSVGKPIAEISVDSASKQIYPSGTTEFTFYVKNYNNQEEINEVLLQYVLQINNISGLNLTYQIYEVSSGEKKLINIDNYKSYLYAGLKQDKQYIIMITWEDESVDASTLDLENIVHIEISFTQVLERK